MLPLTAESTAKPPDTLPLYYWKGRAEEATSFLSMCLTLPIGTVHICAAEREFRAAADAWNQWREETNWNPMTRAQREMSEFLDHILLMIYGCRVVDQVTAMELGHYRNVLANERIFTDQKEEPLVPYRHDSFVALDVHRPCA